MNWGPDGAPQPVDQHKRKVLLQKLSRRAQTLKTSRARSKSGSGSREQLKRCQPPAGSGTKVNPRPTDGPEERSQAAVCPGSALRPKAPRMTEIPSVQQEKMPKFWNFPALNGLCVPQRRPQRCPENKGSWRSQRCSKELAGSPDTNWSPPATVQNLPVLIH